MKQIKPIQFKNAIRKNPAWATTLRDPVEIVGYCYLYKSPITHLSPLLHFSGRNKAGDVARFLDCANLKVAKGTFNGGVSFKRSGIKQIDTKNLIITKPNKAGWAAGFYGCKSLKVAEGKFLGWVCFSASSVERINSEKLNISQPDCEGYAASFVGCEHLRVAEGTFPGWVDFSESKIKKIGKTFKVIKPNQDGKFIGINNSPIEKNSPELKKFLNAIGAICISKLLELRNQVENSDLLYQIEKSILTLRQKSAQQSAVHIDI